MTNDNSVGTLIPFPFRSTSQRLDEDDDFPMGQFFRLAEDGRGVIFSARIPVTLEMSPAQAEELGLILIQAACLARAGK